MDEKPVKCGCSGESRIYSWNEEDDGVQSIHYHAICMKCGIETNAYDTEAEAITAWNKAMGERTVKVTDTWKIAGFEELSAWCPECEHRITRGCSYCPTCGVKLEWE